MSGTKGDEIFDELNEEIKWAEKQKIEPKKDKNLKEDSKIDPAPDNITLSEAGLIKLLREEYMTIRQAATGRIWSEPFWDIISAVLHTLSSWWWVARPTRVVTFPDNKSNKTKATMGRDLPWPR